MSAFQIQGPTGGYTLVQEIIVPSGGSATVDFTSIPASFRQLEVFITAFTENVAAQNLLVRFNGDSSAIYHYQYATVANATFSGSSVGTQTSTIAGVLAATGDADPYTGKMVIPFYARTAHVKEHITDWNNPQVGRGWMGGRWSSTAAINQITFLSAGGSDIKQDSVFALYGIS